MQCLKQSPPIAIQVISADAVLLSNYAVFYDLVWGIRGVCCSDQYLPACRIVLRNALSAVGQS